MLGRLIYVVIVAAVLLAGGFAFDFLANEPGHITLDYGDRLYEVSLFEAAILLVIGIVILMIAVWIAKILFATISFILGNENAFGGIFVRSRERRGLDALGKSLAAIAAGDAKTAQRKAAIAGDKLENEALTRLVNAQAADLAGDRQRAATYYKALMAEPETALAGTKGLLHHALADGDTDRALKLAGHARSLSGKDRETLEVLYSLQSQKFDWAEARKTLTAQVRAGHVPKREAAAREAALILAQAEDAERLGEHEHARALAIEAARMDPANTAAVATAACCLIETGSKRAAAKLITEGWRARPAARLAAAFAEIEPDEAPAQRRRRFETLFALQPDHPETHFLKAELALVNEDWRGARRAIEALRETEPSARSCAIMAAIARGEGEPDHIVRGWLARALGAPRGDDTDLQITQAAMLPLLIGPDADDRPPSGPTGDEEVRRDSGPATDADENARPADTGGPEGAGTAARPGAAPQTEAPLDAEASAHAAAEDGAARSPRAETVT